MKKTTLSAEQVKHIAKLANLVLTEEEVRRFSSQLSQVLDYFTLLDEVKTEGIEETAQVTGLTNVFRKDEAQPGLSSDDALKNAPKKHNQLFKVRSVFER